MAILENSLILVPNCPDTKGRSPRCPASWLREMPQSLKPITSMMNERFYMRAVFRAFGSSMPDVDALRRDFAPAIHGQTPSDLVHVGRDIECRVLARAVTWHIERRVIVADSKTIIFN